MKKLPTMSKADLMYQAHTLLRYKHKDQEAAIEFLLNFFTSVDLVGIIEELKK